MKTIIAGSREITDYNQVKKAIADSGFEITEIVSGGARGVDRLGEKWAEENGIPIKRFIPDWDDISGCDFVKINKYGKEYNPLAGHKRNRQMAEYADVLVAIWTKKSKGTANMIQQMQLLGKKFFVLKV